MKKSLLGLVALTGLMLTSCDLTPKDSTSSVTWPAFNMIIPLDGGEPIISSTPCLYTFDSNLSKLTMKITGNPLTIDNSTYTFTTDSVGYHSYNNYPTNQEGQESGKVISDGAYMVGVKGLLNNAPGLPIKNGKFFYNVSYILPSLSWIPDHPGVIYKGKSAPVSVIARYQLGEEYLVRTFSSDTFYAGNTHTSYTGMDGQPATYDNNSMIYRVLLNIKDKTGTLLIYNPKFSNSPKEPKLEVISIPDLTLTFSSGSYKLTGEDITPLSYEGGGLTKNNSINIKSFEMQTQGEYMVNTNMRYEVEHTMTMGSGESATQVTVLYNGAFNGASAVLPSVAF